MSQIKRRLYLSVRALGIVWLVGCLCFAAFVFYTDSSKMDRRKLDRENGRVEFIRNRSSDYVDEVPPAEAQRRLESGLYLKATDEEIKAHLQREADNDEHSTTNDLDLLGWLALLGLLPLVCLIGGRRWWLWLTAPAATKQSETT